MLSSFVTCPAWAWAMVSCRVGEIPFEKSADWSHGHAVEHFCQSEAAHCEKRRFGRLLAESGLLEGKTLGNQDEALLPLKIRRQFSALLEKTFGLEDGARLAACPRSTPLSIILEFDGSGFRIKKNAAREEIKK